MGAKGSLGSQSQRNLSVRYSQTMPSCRGQVGTQSPHPTHPGSPQGQGAPGALGEVWCYTRGVLRSLNRGPEKLGQAWALTVQTHTCRAHTSRIPSVQGFLCFAVAFCALVQVAFQSYHRPDQVRGQPLPDGGQGRSH